MKKILVCPCEDVTLDEIDECIALGYTDLEEVKRYTGFGTGPCQGKQCLRHVVERCGQRTGEAQPFTARPPTTPTPLGLFAGQRPGGRDKKQGR